MFPADPYGYFTEMAEHFGSHTGSIYFSSAYPSAGMFFFFVPLGSIQNFPGREQSFSQKGGKHLVRSGKCFTFKALISNIYSI